MPIHQARLRLAIVLATLTVLSTVFGLSMPASAQPTSSDRVIDVSRVSPEELKDLAQGKALNSSTVFYVPAGTPLTLNVLVKGEMLELQGGNELRLTFKRAVYARFTSEGPMLSLDNKSWKRPTELTTGTVSLGLSSKKSDSRPVLDLTLDLKERLKK